MSTVRPRSDDEFGLSDPARRARWEREAALMRQQQSDDRVQLRHEVFWIFFVIFLLAVIGCASWAVLYMRSFTF